MATPAECPKGASQVLYGADSAPEVSHGNEGAQRGDTFVICAVLDDPAQTLVRIGAARYCASSCAYAMLDGSLQVSESSRSPSDGLYRDTSGCTHAVMTEKAFAEQCRKQSAAERAAQSRQFAAPSAPPAPPAPPSPPTVRATVPPAAPAAASCTAAVASIGCGVGSNTKTVIVSGNFEGDCTRLEVVMAQSKRVADLAAARGNRVCYAILGNVVPDVHPPDADGESSFSRVCNMATHGITLDKHHSVDAGLSLIHI